MFLSFGGFPIRSRTPAALANKAIRGLHAIHQLGVLQKDPVTRNILGHPDRPGTTWIDFERATLFSRRVTLGGLSANKRGSLGFTTEPSFLRVRMPVQRRFLGLQQSWRDWLAVHRVEGEQEANRLG